MHKNSQVYWYYSMFNEIEKKHSCTEFQEVVAKERFNLHDDEKTFYTRFEFLIQQWLSKVKTSHFKMTW